ncbi:MAG: hypothetical protein QOH21_269 [Acidobacteriota bacterium]|jgi:hypothetical protein|nr:hypothetical protein [Acidobacteriota bacterium]
MSTGAQPDRVRLERDGSSPDDISRQELLDLHRLLVEEYRFQVKLNSDRTQIYLVLNTAILAAATGLMKAGGPSVRTLVALILLVGIYVAHIAGQAVKQGHMYYRTIVYKKTLVEDLLGRHRHIEGYGFSGATLSLETTAGMANDTQILDDAEKWLSRGVRPNTITAGLLHIFRMFAILDAGAMLFIVAMTLAEFFNVW